MALPALGEPILVRDRRQPGLIRPALVVGNAARHHGGPEDVVDAVSFNEDGRLGFWPGLRRGSHERSLEVFYDAGGLGTLPELGQAVQYRLPPSSRLEGSRTVPDYVRAARVIAVHEPDQAHGVVDLLVIDPDGFARKKSGVGTRVGGVVYQPWVGEGVGRLVRYVPGPGQGREKVALVIAGAEGVLDAADLLVLHPTRSEVVRRVAPRRVAALPPHFDVAGVPPS